jgi:hypothetical protein
MSNKVPNDPHASDRHFVNEKLPALHFWNLIPEAAYDLGHTLSGCMGRRDPNPKIEWIGRKYIILV